jgi:hypothetical protein
MRAVFAHARDDVFPPVDVFFDGEVYWLADGFHRYHGAVALDIRLIDCVVHVGSRDDGLWFTCAANAKNGLHRTRDDVRFAIRRALNLPKSGGWSDGRIAEHVGCSPKTVGAVRAEMVAGREIPDLKVRIGKDGVEQDISAKGAFGPQVADLPDADDPDEDEPDADDPEADEPKAAAPAQTDIPGVATSRKVAPLIDPKWAHLPEHMRVVRAHAELPSGSPGENGPWNGLGRPVDGLKGLEDLPQNANSRLQGPENGRVRSVDFSST